LATSYNYFLCSGCLPDFICLTADIKPIIKSFFVGFVVINNDFGRTYVIPPTYVETQSNPSNAASIKAIPKL
jgi:hypothetical protein